jgi:glycosyltransferase involved in cell wall biosynthesis
MDTQHILLVCPDDKNPKLVKQTGQLAVAMLAYGFKVSLQTSADDSSLLQHIPNTQVFLSPEASFKMPWQQDLEVALHKSIQTDETISLVHIVDLTPDTLKLAAQCQRLGVPVICQAQKSNCFDLKSQPFYKRKSYLKKLDSLSHIIVNSQNLLEQAHALNLDNVSYIAEGVDINRFKPVLSKRPVRRELGLPESATIVCCMANIKETNKQIETLKECMPLNDLLHLLFIGEVEDLDYLNAVRAEVSRLGVDAYVSYREGVDNPEDYLKASDAFMLLGGIEDRQGTILEAQSCGIPVILAPSASSLALTGGNKNGVILHPNNQLAKQGVEKLLNDPNYRQGRSIHTRPFVKKHHSMKDMMDSYATLYKNFQQ